MDNIYVTIKDGLKESIHFLDKFGDKIESKNVQFLNPVTINVIQPDK